MPTLPVVKVVHSAILNGQVNGKLDPSILRTWTPSWSNTPVTFIEPAMRCYIAMVTTAYRAGFVLISVGSYRSYERQVALFKERYRRVTFETDVWWDGSFWRHVSGAVAAIPGTSNHGKAIADDLGEQRDSDPSAESISPAAVAWLVANELRFGFSHERQDEPWHVRNTIGDDIPAAVLEFERGEDDMQQDEKLLADTGFKDRRVADVLGDMQNLRNFLIGEHDSPIRADMALPADSVLGVLLAAAKRAPVMAAPVDRAELKAALLDPELLAAIAKAVVAEHARELGN